eukprot:TRINITY_DN250_c0_g4_i1.p2 TRINITY_DN250_c0_g4~~TRINITY_DN250_c0_g4_i1.p2  ORF type:complete len:173 (-),score=40.65 TRINITY_DN250_c0_g4_i1:67-585(-)
MQRGTCVRSCGVWTRGALAPTLSMGCTTATHFTTPSPFHYVAKRHYADEEDDEDETVEEKAMKEAFDRSLWKFRPTPKSIWLTPEQAKQERDLKNRYTKETTQRRQQMEVRQKKRYHLRMQALNELPPDLRTACTLVDAAPLPHHRLLTWTQPIPNYPQALLRYEAAQRELE